MIEKIKNIYQKYKEIILYLIFGVITTVVSLAACYATLKIGALFIGDDPSTAAEMMLDVAGSTVQWVSGVLVAFFTNKKWVFTSAEKGTRATLKQLAVFSGARVATYFIEVFINLGTIALFDLANYKAPTLNLLIISLTLTSRIWAKAVSSVVVVVSNYFISKLIVFKKKKAPKGDEEGK